MRKERLRVRRVRPIHCNPAARSGANLIALDRERFADCFKDLVGQDGGLFRVPEVGLDQGKLIASEPGSDVGLAYAQPQPLGHGLQQQVADRMP